MLKIILPVYQMILQSQHIKKKIKKLDLSFSASRLWRGIELAEARLLLYNKRRPGELEAIELETYFQRPKEKEAHMQNFCGQLSELEEHLLKSQDIVTVRGKHGSPVPILIPADTKDLMEAIADKYNRDVCGMGENAFLFASPRGKVD